MDDEVEIVVKDLDTSPEALRAAIPLLSEAERQRAHRFVFTRDRGRYIAARSQLRRLLGARLGVRPENVELVYGARGKPALAPRLAWSGLRFNVAHCGDAAVYAFASRREVGIDIETVRALEDADTIAGHVFSRRENDMYQALDAHEKPIGFFNCWTRKEAFIKAVGDGFYHPLDRFDVSLAPGEPARILRVGNTPGDRCGWRMDGFSRAPGLIGAVVTEAS